jgi:transposase-like protein
MQLATPWRWPPWLQNSQPHLYTSELNGWRIPPLAEARALWVARFKGEWNWDYPDLKEWAPMAWDEEPSF